MGSGMLAKPHHVAYSENKFCSIFLASFSQVPYQFVMSNENLLTRGCWQYACSYKRVI